MLFGKGVRVYEFKSHQAFASEGLTYLPCARLQVYNLTSVHHCQAKPLRIRQRVLADYIWLPFPHRKLQYLNKMLRMKTLCQATSMISMMSRDVIGLCLQRHPEPGDRQPKHFTALPKRENTKMHMLLNRGRFSTRSDVFFCDSETIRALRQATWTTCPPRNHLTNARMRMQQMHIFQVLLQILHGQNT